MILIAGPCAAENREQVLATASLLAAAGIRVFRAGVWKPRSRPGCFEGVGEDALAWLQEVRALYHMDVATEVANAEQTRLALRYGVNVLWIGARTTTNPFLVQEIADALKDALSSTPVSSQSSDYPVLSSDSTSPVLPSVKVLVKNPLSPDVSLWEGAIQRIAQVVGSDNVMAVHRGFQTGQPSEYRNSPVWSAVFRLKHRLPSVPVLLDASHMAGHRDLIAPLCQQALNLSYDGLMLESHCSPSEALSDADQQLSPDALQAMLSSLSYPSSDQDPATQGLAELRHEIDELDDTFWQALLARMRVSREIGDYKRANGLAIFQRDRYEALLSSRMEWALANGISPETVAKIFEAIHEESCREQMQAKSDDI